MKTKTINLLFDKVQFGCGRNRLPGWSNFDKEMDLRQALPLRDNSVRFAFAEHVIEHLTSKEAWKFLKEIRRILMPSGGFRIVFPALELINQRYDNNYGAFIRVKTKSEATLEGAIESIMCNWEHKTVWTAQGLRIILDVLGFEVWEASVGVSRFPEIQGIDGHGKQIGDHANWVESCVIEGTKVERVC